MLRLSGHYERMRRGEVSLAPVDGGGASGWGWCRVTRGSRVSGLGRCRVAAFSVSGLLRLPNFFITISHCAWRRVISLSLATKKRSKESAFKTRARKLT